jgi:UDP-N-acetylglucosamine acyltransferase
MGVSIHPTALVDPGAELADGVDIGPFCTLGPRVTLAEDVRLISHVSIAGATRIGARTLVYPFSALGHPPQDRKFRGEDTQLVIGSDNLLREHVTMHLGTVQGRGRTVVGDGGYFMAGSHVGHDGLVGDHVTFANNAIIGGVVTVGDYVNLGGHSAVHQLGRIGKYAFIGGGAPVVGDVIPFGMVDNHGGLHGLNLVGLKRRGFPRETINLLRAVYRELFHGSGHFEDRLEDVAARYSGSAEVSLIVDFIRDGLKRPLCVPRPG